MKDQSNPALQFKGLQLSSLQMYTSIHLDFFQRSAAEHPFYIYFITETQPTKKHHSPPMVIKLERLKLQGSDLMITFQIISDAPEGINTTQSFTLLFKEGIYIEGIPGVMLDPNWKPSE